MKFVKHHFLKSYPYYVFFIVAILIICKALNFDIFNNYINGGDTTQSFDFSVYLIRSFQLWDTTSTGSIVPLGYEVFLPNLILQILFFFTHSTILSINFFWIGLLYFVQFSFFLFYKEFLTKEKALLATIATIFSLFFLIFFHTPITFQLIGLTLFPLIYVCLSRYFKTGKVIYIIPFALINLFGFRSLNIIFLANLVALSISIATNKSDVTVRKLVIFLVSATALTFLLCAPYAVNLAYYYTSPERTNEALTSYNDGALSINYLYNLNTIFNFTPNFGFLNDLVESPGWQSQSFSGLYKTLYLIPVTFLPTIIALATIYFKRKDKVILVFGVTLLVLIFLAKGLNQPFGILNQILFSNQVFSLFFRSGALYFLYIIVPLTFVLCLSLKSKITTILIAIYALVNILIMLVLFNPINSYWRSTLPPSYLSLEKHLDSNKKYLILPISDHFAGYAVTKDGYGGPDRLNQISSSSIITKAQGTLVPSDYLDNISALRSDPNQLVSYMQLMNIQHVILEKNSVSTLHYSVNDIGSYRLVMNGPQWRISYSNDDFTVYDFIPNTNETSVGVVSDAATYYTSSLSLAAKQKFIDNLEIINPSFITSDTNHYKQSKELSSIFKVNQNEETAQIKVDDSKDTKLYKNVNSYKLVSVRQNANISISKDFLNNPYLDDEELPFAKPASDTIFSERDTGESYYTRTSQGLQILKDSPSEIGSDNSIKDVEVIKTGKNLLGNPSFETGPWQKIANECSGLNDSGKVSLDIKTDDTSYHKKYLGLSSKLGTACTSTTFPVNSGQFIFSLDYKSEQSAMGGYYISFDDNARSSRGIKLDGNPSWQNYSTTIDVPNGATNARVYLYSYGPSKEVNNVDYDSLNFAKSISTKHIDINSTDSEYKSIDLTKQGQRKNLDLRAPDDYNYKNIIPNPSFEHGLWSEKAEDCSSNDNLGNLGMNITNRKYSMGNSALELISNSHVACTSITFPIESGLQYDFSLDYNTVSARRAGYYLEFNDKYKTNTSKELKASSRDQWKNATQTITTPANSSTATLVLYSFDDKLGNTVLYDNLSLVRRTSNNSDFYTVSSPQKEEVVSSNNKYSIASNSNTRKIINIKESTGNIRVNLFESYQKGWELKDANGNSFGIPDELNGYMNSWLINVNEYCMGNNLCKVNVDGTYDFSLKLIFGPQRFYSISIIISVSTLCALVLLIIVTGLRRKNIHKLETL